MNSTIKIDTDGLSNEPIIKIATTTGSDDLRDKFVHQFISNGGFPDSYLIMSIDLAPLSETASKLEIYRKDAYATHIIKQMPMDADVIDKHIKVLQQLSQSIREQNTVHRD